ncbi:hypothetical protein AgCh_012697 [Apium graveolens]
MLTPSAEYGSSDFSPSVEYRKADVSPFTRYASTEIRSNQKMIVEELDPGTAGPTQVKELTAEIAADPSTHGDRELPKQPALKPKCLFPPPEVPPEGQSLNSKDTLQRNRKKNHFRSAF